MAKDRWQNYALDGVEGVGPEGWSRQSTMPKLDKRKDYRRDLEPVMDQGEGVRASLACALIAIANFTFKGTTSWRGPYTPLSARFLHYQTRAFMQRVRHTGAGISMLDGTSLFMAGSVPEALWPWDPTRLEQEPPKSLEEKRTGFAGLDYQFDPWDGPTGIFRELHEGRLVAFSFTGPADLIHEAGRKGRMPEWTGAPGARNTSGHPMVVVGYDMDKDTLIVRNSFGQDWGDDGYCIMPRKTFAAFAMDWFNYGPKVQDGAKKMSAPEGETRKRFEAREQMMGKKSDGGSGGRSTPMDSTRRSESSSSSRDSLRREINDDLQKNTDDFKKETRDRLRKQEDTLDERRDRGDRDGGGRNGGGGRNR